MAFIIICVVYGLKNIALGTHDDINMFVDIHANSLKEYLSLTISNSLARGRISPIQIIANIILYGVMLTKSQLLYTMLMYIPVIVNVLFFAYIIAKRFGKYFGLFIPVFFFALVQVDAYHNLMISYPLCIQTGLFMFMLGVELFLRYPDKQKKALLLLSALCMFDSFSAYESFVSFYAVFFIIALFKNIESVDNRNSFNWVKFLEQMSVHTVAVLLYITMYLICRHFSNLSYGGATIDATSFSLSLAIKTLFTFAFSLFPLREFVANFSFNTFSVSAITLRMGFKAVCVGIASWMILYKSKKIQTKHMICLAVTGFIACIVFCIPHSLTPQYQYWVSIGVQGFVPSFISYFGIVLILCTIGLYLLNSFHKQKKVFVIVLSIMMSCGSLCTDISNQPTINSKTNDTLRYVMFDKLVQTDYYASLENDAAIYTSDYTGIHNVIASLGDYGKIYCGKDYYFTNDFNDVNQFENKYILKYDNNSGCIILSKINGDGISNEIYIIKNSTSSDQEYFYAVKYPGLTEVCENGIERGLFDTVISIPISSVNDGVLIKGNSIFYNTAIITSSQPQNQTEFAWDQEISVSEDNVPYYIQFLDGWYSGENWGRWSQGYNSGILFLFPNSNGRDINVKMSIDTIPQPDGLNLEIYSQDHLLYKGIVSDEHTFISFTIDEEYINEDGVCNLQLYYDNAVSPNDIGLSTDDRILGIGIKQISFSLIN